MTFRSVRSRAVLLVVLLGALAGLSIWYASLGPDPAAGAFPDSTELTGDYDRYVDERVEVGGVVVSVEPLVMAVPDETGDDFELTVEDVSADRVDVGDNLRVYGVAESDRSIRSLNAVVVPSWGRWYAWAASFLAGLWVLGRIATQWRVGAGGLVPRSRAVRVRDRLRSTAGEEADDA